MHTHKLNADGTFRLTNKLPSVLSCYSINFRMENIENKKVTSLKP